MIIIRSQDRTILIEVNEVQINTSENSREVWYKNGLVSCKLGTYETKERALEVLDMIQERIMLGTKYDTIWNGTRTTKDHVFEMPKE
ncbi:hypothetical protein DP125_13330 [Clostridium tetani]|uniref:hypothetical protein n=1 Tax=Clostridium tetani TaxID=1513 RepID=UPI00100B5534|nr:hypothetical protein [Clostridium tetani]RXI57671.1 hypothetical protein DP125_13330 [Clostridium tetani]